VSIDSQDFCAIICSLTEQGFIMTTAHKLEDHIGRQYNRVTIVGDAPRIKKEKEWLYSCVCGNTGQATPSNLIKGNVKSCGCLRKETCVENVKKASSSPLCGKWKKHGMFGTRPYRIWVGMKTRCNNEKVREFPDYGGRGISYCSKWESFEGFWEDMKEGYSDILTIDRTDTNGNYEKINCEWVDMSVQSHHRRKRKGSSTKMIGVKERGQGRFEATFCKNGVIQYLGTFPTEYEAAQAYDDAYEIVYGLRNNKTERKPDDSN
jgi:hypothetical protein